MRTGTPVWAWGVALALVLAACSDGAPLPTDPLAPVPPGARLNTAAASTPYRYACATGIAPRQDSANVQVLAAYNDFRSKYVTLSGAPVGERVHMGDTEGSNYKTSSEAMGYGMLAAAYMGDKASFDSLWAYAREYLNGNGLMKWEIDRYGTALSPHAATDGDEDMAFALVVADRKWGGYAAAAGPLIASILAHEVHGTNDMLLPGDGWGSLNTTVNPSMFGAAYYRVFASYTGVTRWNAVRDTTYALLAKVDAKNPYGKGLVPDFATFAGDSAAGKSYDYTWDAIRAPWRLAMDAAWYCDARAKARLDKLNTFFSGIGAANIKSGYDLSGALLPNQWHETGFVAAAASASLTSTSTAYRTSVWNEMVAMLGPPYSNYFNDALRLLNMLLASGNMPNPLDAATARKRVDDFETGGVSRWWTYNDPASTVTTSLVRPAAVGYGMKVDYAVSSYAGVGTSFGPAANWTGYRGVDFWVQGGGTGNSIRVEIEDNGSERFEFRFTDNFTGWRYFSVPWSAFERRTDWQPAGAPADGLTLTGVLGLIFSPLGGSGSFRLDRIELVPS